MEKADVVIWDGMFTKEELRTKAGWGHSSIEQGIDFFSTVNCGQIIISHHAPYRTDAELDKINQKPVLYLLREMGLTDLEIYQNLEHSSFFYFDKPLLINSGDKLRIKAVKYGWAESNVIEVP